LRRFRSITMSHTFAFATVLLASSLSTAAALAATTVQSIHVGARSGVYLGDQFVDQQESLYPDPASIIGRPSACARRLRHGSPWATPMRAALPSAQAFGKQPRARRVGNRLCPDPRAEHVGVDAGRFGRHGWRGTPPVRCRPRLGPFAVRLPASFERAVCAWRPLVHNFSTA